MSSKMSNNAQQSNNAIDRLEILFKKISRYDFYINSTHSKASIIIAWNGIVIGTILLKYNPILNLFLTPKWSYYIANTILIIMAISSIISIALMFRVVNPFLSSGNENINFKSLMFFGDVTKMSLDEYKKKEVSINYDEVLSDTIKQAHILATGLNDKMKNMQWSIKAINFGLLALLLLLLLKGVITYGL